MPPYLYTAKNKQGENQTGRLAAENKHKLAGLLRQKGLILISAQGIEEETNKESLFNKISQKLGHISLVEKMVFTRHLGVMNKAGLPLNQSLYVLAQQTKNAKFAKIINQIETEIRRGQSFSDTLSKHPKIFNRLYVSMIQVAEASGKLDEVLEILAEQMRKNHELIKRVRGAMLYPAVIIAAMIGIGILMMIMVVPKLTAIFDELEVELPLSTRIIIGLSNFLQGHLIWSFLILIASILLIRLILKNLKVKRLLHQSYIYLPILGSLVQKINSARFARTFSSLIASGVPIVKALQIVSQTLSNLKFRESLEEAAEKVQKGQDLSQLLAKYENLYLPMVIQMIKVGEKTGRLTEILTTLAEFYEGEIDSTTKNLSSIIEPVIMIIIGAAVGFFAVSMIQPMYSMMGGI